MRWEWGWAWREKGEDEGLNEMRKLAVPWRSAVIIFLKDTKALNILESANKQSHFTTQPTQVLSCSRLLSHESVKLQKLKIDLAMWKIRIMRTRVKGPRPGSTNVTN